LISAAKTTSAGTLMLALVVVFVAGEQEMAVERAFDGSLDELP
jgi:hypothetical protein